MYAIVEIAGQQFKVAKDQKVFVHRLQEKEGSKITFDNVLLLDDGKVTVGAPAIEGAAVTAKILKHLKGDKVIVFKKKRRKGYKVRNGHRQYLSEIQIENIVASGAKKAPAKKEEPKKETAPKVVAKKAAAPVKAEVPKKETVKVENTVAAPKKEATTKKAKADDLKKIEGIGPKIAETLIAAGIATFADLAKAKPAKISEIIAGVRGNHIPDTWPQQAKLATDGKWDELKELQDKLDGGKA
ncbi:MAG: 50S ribosomal protein L21 [Aureibaculum sp.]